jgi:hypothetical protein
MAKDVIITVGGDDSAFQKTMNSVSSKMADVGEKMKNVGKTMSTYLTLPILAAGAASFKLASDFDESLNKVNVAFKESSEAVKEWAKTSLKSFGIAEGTALDMAALFGDMATSMGLPQDKAADLSVSMVGLAGDLASFKNIGIDQAMTALNGVFTGETESLKMLGIVMTEANLKAFALSQGIQKNVQDMTQAEKVNLRYAYVMQQTTNAQGDFSRTSGGAANQMRIFQESLKEIGVQFGQIILPFFTKVIAKINEWAAKFKNLDDSTKKIIIVVAGLAAAIGPLLIALGFLTTTIIPMLVAGGAAVSAAWLPVTAIVLGIYGAYKLFNIEATKTAKIVDSLSKKTLVELEIQKGELSKKLDDELKNAGFGEKLNLALSVGGNVFADFITDIRKVFGVESDIEKTIRNLNAVNQSIAIRKKAQQDIEELNKTQALAAETAAKAAKEAEEAEEARLGRVGQLQKQIRELNETFKFANTADDVAKITRNIEALQLELDKLYKPDIVKEEALKPITPIDAKSVTPIKEATLALDGLYSTWKEFLSISDTVAIESTFQKISSTISATKQIIVDLGKEISYLLGDVITGVGESLGGMFGDLFGRDEIKKQIAALNEELKLAETESEVKRIREEIEALDKDLDIGNGFKEAGQKMLLQVADWAGKFGAILIAAAIASEAFQKSLAGNPVVALVAGIALVAAASAVKSIIAKRNDAGSGGSGGGGGGSQNQDGGAYTGVRGLFGISPLAVSVTGEFVVQGNNLVAAIANETTRSGY